MAKSRNVPPAAPARVWVNVRRSMRGFGERQVWATQAAMSTTPARVGPHERTAPNP